MNLISLVVVPIFCSVVIVVECGNARMCRDKCIEVTRAEVVQTDGGIDTNVTVEGDCPAEKECPVKENMECRDLFVIVKGKNENHEGNMELTVKTSNCFPAKTKMTGQECAEYGMDVKDFFANYLTDMYVEVLCSSATNTNSKGIYALLAIVIYVLS